MRVMRPATWRLLLHRLYGQSQRAGRAGTIPDRVSINARRASIYARFLHRAHCEKRPIATC